MPMDGWLAGWLDEGEPLHTTAALCRSSLPPPATHWNNNAIFRHYHKQKRIYLIITESLFETFSDTTGYYLLAKGFSCGCVPTLPLSPAHPSLTARIHPLINRPSVSLAPLRFVVQSTSCCCYYSSSIRGFTPLLQQASFPKFMTNTR